MQAKGRGLHLGMINLCGVGGGWVIFPLAMCGLLSCGLYDQIDRSNGCVSPSLTSSLLLSW